MLPLPRPEDARPDDPATIEALRIALTALRAEADDAHYEDPRIHFLATWLPLIARLADERDR